MRKFSLLASLLLIASPIFSQLKVRFVVQQPEPTEDTVYLVGSFNDWNPADNNYLLKPLDANHYHVEVKLPAGHYEFKFTRGVWSTVEGAETGLDISNRAIELRRDTTVHIKIEGWMDKFKDFPNLPDVTKWYVLYSRSFFYLDTNLDSSYKYAQEANALLPRLNNKKYEADMARILGRIMQRQGNHQRALEYYLRQLSLVENLKDTLSMAFCLLDIGDLFLGIKDYPNAKDYYVQVRRFDPDKTESFGRSAPNLALVGIGRVFYNTHQLDSARYYALQAYETALRKIDRPTQSEALTLLGNILEQDGRRSEAIKYYQLAIQQAQIFANPSIVTENYQNIAQAFYKEQQIDSSLYYAHKAFAAANEIKNPYTVMDASNMLVALYKQLGQTDSAFKYLETLVAAKDSLFNQNKNQQLQTILFNEKLQEQQNKAEDERFKNQVKMYIMAAGLVVLLVVCILLWWNVRRKLQVNRLLNEQGGKMQKTLTEIKTLKAQLSRKEKMASLGEFATGTAHEIQDPIDTINNLSKENANLAKELKSSLAAADISLDQQSKLNSLADALLQNQQEITEKAHQADVIVKDMLEHSGKTLGEDSLLI
jgi:two-component system NtrC family sensor kinase